MLLRNLSKGASKKVIKSSLTTNKTSAVRATASQIITQQQTRSNSVDSFANVHSARYLEELEQQWLEDPASVDPQWNTYFSQLKFASPVATSTSAASGLTSAADTSANTLGHKISDLVRAYQVNGHRISDLDPLGIAHADLDGTFPQELALENYGFSQEDLNRPISIGRPLMKGFLDESRGPITLKQLIERLKQVYCSKIGYEYMHIDNRQQCNWIRDKIETPEPVAIPNNEKLVILERLLFSDTFETYLASKFPTTKRFGLEGGESLIPGLKAVVDAASSLDCTSYVIGMAHRGRLNVLANVMRKPLENLFAEFQGNQFSRFGTGDVKYHLGANCKRKLPYNNKDVELSLCANPSHLEAVDPVVEGKTRAKQFYGGDADRTKNMSILIHGDASFAGQGIVYETMGLSDLKNYTTGGTVHIVINNQIGFTTNPRQSRSSPYATDLSKFIGAPIFHCNGDDPESVVKVCKLAAQWRQEFHKDVVVDIVCYRRNGHNEIDQPMFTQPIMYKKIASHPSTLTLYSQQLLKEGVISQEDYTKMQNQVKSIFDEAFAKSKNHIFDLSSEWYGATTKWAGIKTPDVYSQVRQTGVKLDTLQTIGQALATVPEGFKLNPGVKRVLDGRGQMAKSGEGIDWGMAEALAFGSLLKEKFHVRLSGQDVERGTFSHRHAVVVHQDTEEKYTPLNHITNDQAEIHVCNSSLSEYGVLGFELGYSLENPNALILWEGQFGDFANGAQIIIDQFLSSGEQKWYKSTGLVVLLPHGYEGQGPEHSNARLERFLQLTDEDPDTFPTDLAPEVTKQIQRNNWQVLNCSTPANYFHALRRQLHRDFRKPLIIMTPKSLLRHKLAASKLEEFAEGTKFQSVIPEQSTNLVADDKIRKLVFCSGKVYYDLLQHREEQNINDVALVRVEQLSPFPFDKVAEAMKKYPNASVTWTQEEPKNYGAWNHFYFRALTCLKHIGRPTIDVKYVGRGCGASPSTGFSKVHKDEQEKLIKDTFA